ncbi:MAG: CPBP family intramembrane metalloprotease [Sphingobacteriaceae bacterium]|nr:CPBP family intramembrane metalloprotease [Sphingobacteriaceae bacterium]
MFTKLDVDLEWKENDLVSFLPIILSLCCFVLYWFTAASSHIKNKFYNKYSFDDAARKHIFFTKYFGFISMGIIPLVICMLFLPKSNFSDYGLTFIPETSLYSLIWTLGLGIVVVPIAFLSAKKEKNLVNYPQIRSKTWTKKTIFITILGWSLYLFGYELLFRGTLLFPLVDALGVWPAIAVNIGMYSATHIPKGLDETLGAIPLGLVLCLLTLYSGTIWIAFFVHLFMAITNCLTAFKYHPDIKYQA